MIRWRWTWCMSRELASVKDYLQRPFLSCWSSSWVFAWVSVSSSSTDFHLWTLILLRGQVSPELRPCCSQKMSLQCLFSLLTLHFKGSAPCARVLKFLIPATVVPQEAVVRAVAWLCIGKIPVNTQVESTSVWWRGLRSHAHLFRFVLFLESNFGMLAPGSFPEVGPDCLWHDWLQGPPEGHLWLHLQLCERWKSGECSWDAWWCCVGLYWLVYARFMLDWGHINHLGTYAIQKISNAPSKSEYVWIPPQSPYICHLLFLLTRRESGKWCQLFNTFTPSLWAFPPFSCSYALSGFLDLLISVTVCQFRVRKLLELQSKMVNYSFINLQIKAVHTDLCE